MLCKPNARVGRGGKKKATLQLEELAGKACARGMSLRVSRGRWPNQQVGDL